MATANRIVSVDVRGVLVQVELLPLLLLLLLLFLLLFFHFILNFDYTANTLMSVFLDSWCPLIRALCAFVFVYAYKSTRCFSFAFKCSQSTFIHSVILILAFPLSFSTLFTRVTFGKSCRRSSNNNYNHMYNGNKNKSHALMNTHTHTHGKFTCNTLTVLLCIAHTTNICECVYTSLL